MSLSDELKELEALRQNGTLTQEEFQLAKQRVLSGGQVTGQSDHLEQIQRQNDVAQLDREWALERENYMQTGNHGARFIPGKASSVMGGLFIGAFGICWTIMASSMPGPGGGMAGNIMPLFGIAFVIFGVTMCGRGFIKAGQYQEALGSYQSRRRELIGKQRSTQDTQLN
jgi:hypothetical protein